MSDDMEKDDDGISDEGTTSGPDVDAVEEARDRLERIMPDLTRVLRKHGVFLDIAEQLGWRVLVASAMMSLERGEEFSEVARQLSSESGLTPDGHEYAADLFEHIAHCLRELGADEPHLCSDCVRGGDKDPTLN